MHKRFFISPFPRHSFLLPPQLLRADCHPEEPQAASRRMAAGSSSLEVRRKRGEYLPRYSKAVTRGRHP
jgi:hypothetical protein